MEQQQDRTTSMGVVEVANEVAQATVDKKRTLDSEYGCADASEPVELVEVPTIEVRCCNCSAQQVKYRCPRCERITCSLACCLAHKKDYACNGKRDRTKYIPTKHFSDSDLSSDFFFLEEVSRSTNSAARCRNKLGVTVRRYGQARPPTKKRRSDITTATCQAANPHVPADWLSRFPVAFQLLVQQAAKRGIPLTLLAPGMSKRVRNTSYMDTRTSTLYWRVEWNFASAEVPVSLFETRTSDANTPCELLEQYLERRPDNTGLRGKLKKYAVPNWHEHIAFLLRKEFTPSSRPQYYRLDGAMSLESNFKRKAIVEFPVITVVLRSDLHKYALAIDAIEVVDNVCDGHADEQTQDAIESCVEDDHQGTGSDDCVEVGVFGAIDIEESSASMLSR